LLALALITPWITVGILAAKRYPRLFPAVRKHVLFRSLGTIVPLVLGYIVSQVFKSPIVYEKELTQGILTASSILLALNGVMLRLAKFPDEDRIVEAITAWQLRVNLLLSLLAGLITIFLALAWFAHGTPNLIEWATFGLFVQLGYLLIFLLLPRYYLF
jgi:hypothetical protein